MKVIKLKIRQNLANYRKPLNYQIKESYPLPPYSTIIGMVHKACNFKEYHPMKVSIQGKTNFSINDIYTKYTFAKNATYCKNRKMMKVQGKNKTYGIIKGVGNIELIQDIELLIHIKPDDEEEMNYIYEKLKKPDTFLAIGRHEDLIDIEKVEIVECQEKEKATTHYSAYVPIDKIKVKNTIYKLPKEFYIDEKTRLRKFKEPIKVCLITENENIEDVYVDNENNPVVLC